ncbi:transcriptional corepressor SEUSS [Magnolia sinica]|uniref:transcriptional corepressor SEUSS n=1 Tax=Magnolia sinica TaxID=86752 RepID=UPI002657BA8C|nr:transcriptional corepressor SEUSS [Magnolia sinica]XP_058097339.1 transcriptional corepressor SEUSS [Magnolia sinica]
MVPSGPPTPVGGAQSVSPSLLRTNSGILGAQGGSAPSQPTFPSLLSPRSQYNNMNVLGNMPNVSSLLNQSYGNGGSNSGLLGSGSLQRGGIDMGAESDPLSSVGNGMSFTPSPASFGPSNVVNPGSSGQAQGQHFPNSSGNQLAPDQQQPQQLESQNFQHGQQSLQQFPVPHNQQQQQQYQSLRGGLSNVGTVKLEPQMSNDQNGPQQQQLQPLRSLASVKLEPQQLPPLRNLGQVKIESQHSEQPLFLQQQQQQQQLLHMSRQTPQAAAAQMNLLQQQQRFLQLQQQQQQQQQIFKAALPQQRSQLQQQFQQQNLPVRAAVKSAIYEPGTCARRLTNYMYHQQHRPADNNIDFWRKFVAEYFALNAKKRWCVSLYGSGRQTTGVFPQDAWHCEICNRKPGRGFETTVEVLPRLCKIKYDSGTLEELLYVDMPREYQNSSGQIVLDYAKAIQESVFEQLRVVRDGQLRIVFSSDLKICSWEFCARRHEELIPRRLIIPQVSQLGAVAQKYQAATQNASSNLSAQDLQTNCNMFVASARQLAKALEVPLVNELGYTKRYVRCLQISEVVNSMKDLIDYSRETGTGPMASLINFPRRTAAASGPHSQSQQPEEQSMTQNSNNDQNSIQTNAVQLAASNGVVNVNNSLNPTSTPTSTSTIVGLLHQNSMNSRQENSMSTLNSPYGGTTVQIPSASSSNSLPQSQANPSSPFPSPTLSASNNPQQTSHNALTSATTSHLNSANSPANIPMQQPSQASEAEPNDSQSSVQQIIQEMMMSSQLNGGGGMVSVGSLGNEIKGINGITHTGNTVLNGLVGNGIANNSSVGFGNMGRIGSSATPSGIRAAMSNNSVMLNGRVGMPSMSQETTMNHQQQQDMGNRQLGGLGTVNTFNNLQFDWKSSP